MLLSMMYSEKYVHCVKLHEPNFSFERKKLFKLNFIVMYATKLMATNLHTPSNVPTHPAMSLYFEYCAFREPPLEVFALDHHHQLQTEYFSYKPFLILHQLTDQHLSDIPDVTQRLW